MLGILLKETEFKEEDMYDNLSLITTTFPTVTMVFSATIWQ
jgi:hypothetical protein